MEWPEAHSQSVLFWDAACCLSWDNQTQLSNDLFILNVSRKFKKLPSVGFHPISKLLNRIKTIKNYFRIVLKRKLRIPHYNKTNVGEQPKRPSLSDFFFHCSFPLVFVLLSLCLLFWCAWFARSRPRWSAEVAIKWFTVRNNIRNNIGKFINWNACLTRYDLSFQTNEKKRIYEAWYFADRGKSGIGTMPRGSKKRGSRRNRYSRSSSCVGAVANDSSGLPGMLQTFKWI